jgi:hypothetical protein
MPAAPQWTDVCAGALDPPPSLPKMTPYRGTNTELSISKNGSKSCMGSTIAKPVQRTAMPNPQAFKLTLDQMLWLLTEAEYTSP